MDIENTIRKFSLDKVAMLLFLLLGLFAAKMLVFVRNEKPNQAGMQLMELARSGKIFGQSDSLRTGPFFLMKNKQGQGVGFYINYLTVENGTLKGASFSYMMAPLQERVMFFEGAVDLNEFVWKYDAASPAARISLQTKFSDSILSITNFELAGREYRLKPQQPWLPDIVMLPLIRNMLDLDMNKAILGLLAPEGRLIPAMISKVKTKSEEYEVITIEYFEAERIVETYVFNKDGSIEEINTNSGYIFQPTDMETIISLFPEKADFILQQFDSLRDNQEIEPNDNIYENSV